jgi:hypothetical protein
MRLPGGQSQDSAPGFDRFKTIQNGEQTLHLAALVGESSGDSRVCRPRVLSEGASRESCAHIITAFPTSALLCFSPSRLRNGQSHRNSRIGATFTLNPPTPLSPRLPVAKLSVCAVASVGSTSRYFVSFSPTRCFDPAFPFPSSLFNLTRQSIALGTGDLIRPLSSILSTSSCVVRSSYWSTSILSPRDSFASGAHPSLALSSPTQNARRPPLHLVYHISRPDDFVSHHGPCQHSN